MKIKLDENIPLRLQPLLAQLGHQVDTVKQESLIGCTDERLIQAARISDRFLITQDMDFSDVQRFEPGTHPGILIIRLRAGGREALFQRLKLIFQNEAVDTWKGCLVIISERKVRIRRPQN